MNDILDTIVWIANVPATYGYAMVFLAAFGSAGIIGLGFRGTRSRRDSRLTELRAERGQPVPAGAPVALLRARNWFFRVLALAMIGSGVIGLLSLVNGPVTAAYIYEHGETTTGTVPEDLSSDWVRFTASDGITYTLPFAFFSPPSYPEDESVAFAADELVIRYLPGHPQAYVLDTRATLDSQGQPIGD